MAGNSFTSCQVSPNMPACRAEAGARPDPNSTPESAPPPPPSYRESGYAWCPLRMRLVERVWCLWPLPWAWGSVGWGNPPGLGMSAGTSSNGATEKCSWGGGKAVSSLTSVGPSSGFLGAAGQGLSQDAWPRGRAAHTDRVSDLCFTSVSLTLPTCEIDLGLAWEHLA